jgi:uncharacterized repeat protein (TIGR03943 family)
VKLSVPRLPTVVAALSATVLIRLSVTGDYSRYVKSVMRWPLLFSGLVLAAMALIGLLSQKSPHEGAQDSAHDHNEDNGNDHGNDCDDHSSSPIGWLLVLPVLAVLVVAPPSLSGWGLSGQANAGANSRGDSGGSQPSWSQLDTTPGVATKLSMWDFVGRALEPESPTVTGREVELIGFIVEDPKASSDNSAQFFEVARYSIACCAADGRAARIRITGSAKPTTQSAGVSQTWVQLTGELLRIDGDIPVLTMTSLNVIEEPDNPYED